jgi:hypothetical protein
MDKLTELLIKEKVKNIKQELETTDRHIQDSREFLERATGKDEQWEAEYVRRILDTEIKHKALIKEAIELYTHIFKENKQDFNEWWVKVDKEEEKSK